MRELEAEVMGKKEKDKEKEDLKKEMEKMALTRGGGAYIPPFRLAQMNLQNPTDKGSEAYQRMTWEALRKSINGLINKVNVGNIKMIIPELFNENLHRGRGLFCRSVMRAQASSQPFTPVFASMVAIINTKLPQVGELLVTRLVSQFRRAYKRNDKTTSIATSLFIAHLVNQQVVGELLALEIVALLLGKVSDDSVEIAVGFMKEVGAFLGEVSPKATNGIFDEFRRILNEDLSIGKRSQYQIEVLFQVRKDKFKDNVTIPDGLDLVEDEDVVCHNIALDDELQVMDMLNVFKFDSEFEKNEEKYEAMKKEILGDSGSDESSESGGEESEEEPETGIGADGTVAIHDHTGTDLTNLRRTIYLTIMSALDFEEAVHKLLKLQLRDGEEIELVNMIIECCSQERTYSKFYGLMGERFCKLNPVWRRCFEGAFKEYFTTIHRFETNRLRNIARLFGHLLGSDAVSWEVFEIVKINEDDTTSSSRIFIKILLHEVVEMLGLKTFAERFKDPSMSGVFTGMFPTDNPKNTRFAINYFTSLSYGILTEGMREHLKNAPQLIMQRRMEESSSSDSDTSSDDDTSDTASTGSRSRSGTPQRSPPRRRRFSSPSSRGNGQDIRSRSPPARRRGEARSRSPASRQRRGGRDSRSPSPSPHRGGRRGTRSPSPRRRQARSPSPAPRGRGRTSPSYSPPRRGRRDSPSYSPPQRRDRSMDSRSRSPPPHQRNKRDYSPRPDRRGRDRDSPPRREFDSPPRRARRYS
ncbi:MIF4G-domain-containing protein [Atractiella rhizophila]|nr:MIF4G-domain-containing protein [Atractiella rhizophila]